MYYKGRLLTLRKPEEIDVQTLITWHQTPDFMQFLYGSPLASTKKINNQVYQILNANAQDSNNSLVLIMESVKINQPFGIIMFQNINWKDQTAELNIAIGEEKYKNSFYGFEAYLMALLFGFSEWNLNKIYGYVYEQNKRANHISAYAGELEGTLRSHYFRDGKYINVNIYSYFKESFKKALIEKKDTLLKKYNKVGLLNDFL